MMAWLWNVIRKMFDHTSAALQGLIEGTARSREGERVLRAVRPFRAYGFRNVEVIPVGADVESTKWDVESYVNSKLAMLRLEMTVCIGEPIVDTGFTGFLVGPVTGWREEHLSNDRSMVAAGFGNQLMDGWNRHRVRVDW
jgi:hypothetical protein